MLATTQWGALLHFQAGWQETLMGDIAQGEPLTIHYDPKRLPVCRSGKYGTPIWWIQAEVRFYPSGETYVGPLVGRPVDAGWSDPLAPVPFTVPVPVDATQVEMWFHNSDYASCNAWDSRFGQNYRFSVARRGPQQPVAYRVGARRNPSIVYLAESVLTKRNVFPRTPSNPGADLQVQGNLKVWVKNLAYTKQVLIDVHGFDASDALVHAQTYALTYAGSSENGGDYFRFDGKLYQGAIATPGSVSPRPDVRKVQYRLYYEVNGETFTDGVLHQVLLPEDALVLAGAQG